MIAHFDHLGVVEAREGPKDAAFPAHFEVEDQHKPIHDAAADAEARTGSVRHDVSPHRVSQHVDLSTIEKVRRFPAGLRS